MVDKTGGTDISEMTPENRRQFNRTMVLDEKGKRQSKKNAKVRPWATPAEKPTNP